MDMSGGPDWSEILTGQMLACGLLGKALYYAPDKAWLDSLIDQEVFAEAPFGGAQPDVADALVLLRKWTGANRGGLSEPAFDAVEADFGRLFVGPDKLLAAPWESVYANRERMLFQQVTVEVRNWYSRFGLELASGINEPEDHIGLELGFLAHLARLSLEALRAGDVTQFDKLIEAGRDFTGEHLLSWVPKWSREMHTHARTDFFKGMGRLARGVVKELDVIYRVSLPDKPVMREGGPS